MNNEEIYLKIEFNILVEKLKNTFNCIDYDLLEKSENQSKKKVIYAMRKILFDNTINAGSEVMFLENIFIRNVMKHFSTIIIDTYCQEFINNN